MKCTFILLLLSRNGAPFCQNPRLPPRFASGVDRFKIQGNLPTSKICLNISSASTNKVHKNQNDEIPHRRKVLVATLNLVKALAGSGVLALPSGVAAMGNYKESLVPALVIMVSLGALSAYTFGLYGRLLHIHQAKTLGELWEKEIGRDSSWVISLATMTFCFGAALSYSILLGDTFSALAGSVGLQGIFIARSFWIALLMSSTLYPICTIDSLHALAPLSIAGVAAVVATTCFLGWRCPSVNQLSPYSGCGAFIGTLAAPMVPQFNTYKKHFLSPSSTLLVGMAATSYLGHFSAPSFYASLKPTNRGPDKPPLLKDLVYFNMVTFLGFVSATLLNCLVMSFGFLTFGGSSSGVILNNFSIQDPGASFCRLLMAVSVIGGYPFLVSSIVNEVVEFRGVQAKLHSPRETEKAATSWTLLVLAFASLIMKDAGFVISFSGAVMGSFIVYIFPALLNLSNSGKQQTAAPIHWMKRAERLFCRVLICFGVVVAVLGGSISVISSYFPHMI